MKATLSIMGLMNAEPNLLNSTVLSLPTGIDRDILVPLLLAETAELEVLYADPAAFKIIMTAWSKARLPSWTRWVEAMTQEYNPLHNFDRFEDYEDTGSKSNSGRAHSNNTSAGSQNADSSDAQHINGHEHEARTNIGSEHETQATTGHEKETQKNAGYDSTTTRISGEITRDRSEDNSSTHARSENDSSDRDRSESISNAHHDTLHNSNESTQESNYNGSEANRNRHVGHLFGNIGVTTSATMLKEEVEVRKMDLYNMIVKDIRDRFCLLVY